MSKITAEDIVKLFEEDIRSRKRLAELLVIEPDIRLAIINAIIKDVATKEDIAGLSEELSSLRERVARLEGSVSLLVKLFIAFNVPILVGIIGILLKMILTP